MGDRLHGPRPQRRQAVLHVPPPTPRSTSRRSRIPSTRARRNGATGRTSSPRWTTSPAGSSTSSRSSASPTTRSSSGPPTREPTPPIGSRPGTPIRTAANGTGSSGPWRGGLFTSLEGSNRTPCIIRWPNKGPGRKGQQRDRPPGGSVHDPRQSRRRQGARRPHRRRDGHDRLPPRRRRGVRPGHRPLYPGQPATGGEVAPVEDPPVQTGRLLLDLGPVQHALPAQP